MHGRIEREAVLPFHQVRRPIPRLVVGWTFGRNVTHPVFGLGADPFNLDCRRSVWGSRCGLNQPPVRKPHCGWPGVTGRCCGRMLHDRVRRGLGRCRPRLARVLGAGLGGQKASKVGTNPHIRSRSAMLGASSRWRRRYWTVRSTLPWPRLSCAACTCPILRQTRAAVFRFGERVPWSEGSRLIARTEPRLSPCQREWRAIEPAKGKDRAAAHPRRVTRSRTDARVISDTSTSMGHPVFSWMIETQSQTAPPTPGSASRSRTRSQPSSALSIARLRDARSHARSGRARMARTWLGGNGRFGPMGRP